jgi:hypothetical protein
MSNNTLVSVNFNNQTLTAVLVNDIPHVALKPICENLGIDWEGQRQKIARHPVLNQVACMIKATSATGADGKSYMVEMLMLPIKFLNGWLFGIDSSRVKSEAKEAVIKYQRECFEVLANHFMPKIPYGLKETAPTFASIEMQRHVQEMVHARSNATGKHYNTIYDKIKTQFEFPRLENLPVTKYQPICKWFGEEPKYKIPAFVTIPVDDLEVLNFYKEDAYRLHGEVMELRLRTQSAPALNYSQFSKAVKGELVDDGEITHVKYQSTGRVVSASEFIQEAKENPLSSWQIVHKDWVKRIKEATNVLAA